MQALEFFQFITTSLLGFIGGFLLGRMGRELHEVKEVVVDAEVGKHNAGVAEQERRSGQDRRHQEWSNFNRVMAVILIILAIASVVVGSIAIASRNAALDCQAKFNAAFSASLSERAKAASEDRQAITDLIAATAKLQANPPPTREEAKTEFQKILDDYLATVAASDARRAAAPIPEPPKENCS